jgi:hypothetical protein
MSANNPHRRYEAHRLERYQQFAHLWGIEDFDRLVELYDIDQLWSALPAQPAEADRQALHALLGVTGEAGYIDQVKSGNTFELIMQFREQTGRFGP